MSGRVWSKADVLTAVQQARVELEWFVLELDAGALIKPGVTGIWSAKDVLAHLASVQEWLAEQIAQVARGEPATPDQIASVDPELLSASDHWNALSYAEHHDRPLEDIVSWWRLADDDFQAALGSLPAEQYAEPQWWTSGLPLIATLDPGHGLAHARDICDWARRGD